MGQGKTDGRYETITAAPGSMTDTQVASLRLLPFKSRQLNFGAHKHTALTTNDENGDDDSHDTTTTTTLDVRVRSARNWIDLVRELECM